MNSSLYHLEPNHLPKLRPHHNFKKRSSTGSIFGLPRSILENVSRKTINNIQSNNKLIEKKQSFAKQYQNHLRNTIINQRREVYRPLKKNSVDNLSLQKSSQSKFQTLDPQILKKPEAKNLLQKIILQDSYTQRRDEKLQLRSKKLPIVVKKDSPRRKIWLDTMRKEWDKVRLQKDGSSKRLEKELEKMERTNQGNSFVDKNKPFLSGWEEEGEWYF